MERIFAMPLRTVELFPEDNQKSRIGLNRNTYNILITYLVKLDLCQKNILTKVKYLCNTIFNTPIYIFLSFS